MFFSSVGFSILIAYILLQAVKRFNLSQQIFMILVGAILSLYSIKTFSRNFDWKDNFTLFMTDVKVSDNSSKIHTSCGGDLAKNAEKEPDSLKKRAMLEESVKHLKRAIEIYPSHSNAWLLLGNSLYKLNKDPKEAIDIYTKASAYRVGGYYDALYNLGCVQVENGMASDAVQNFRQALSVKNDVFECKYNLAEAYSKSNKPDSAIIWYNEALKMRPNDAVSYYKIGTIYGKQLGNLDMAIQNLEKALSLNSSIEVYYEDLAVAYGLKGKIDDAISTSLKCLSVNPNYLPAINNLIVSYRIKGDFQQAAIYESKLQAVR
jgi:tetratricopeptide (TPR) repeat protein